MIKYCLFYCSITLLYSVYTKTVPYGSWISEVTSEHITSSFTALRDLKYAQNTGEIFWLETRSDDDVSQVCSVKLKDLSNIVCWTPENYSVVDTVHEYGGGAFTVSPSGFLYFTNEKDQAVYEQKSPQATPKLITEIGLNRRYADGFVLEGGSIEDNVLYLIEEDHSDPTRTISSVINRIVEINLITLQRTIVASGADFYAYPQAILGPTGINVYWMQWDKPNMPWDNTEIWVGIDARFDKNNSSSPFVHLKILGNDGINYQQPQLQAGNHAHPLYVVSDQTGFWNVYSAKIGGGSTKLENIAPMDVDIGGPLWMFGRYDYTFSPSGNKIVIFAQNGTYIIDKDGQRPINTEIENKINGELNSGSILFPTEDILVTLGSNPTLPEQIQLMHLNNGSKVVIRTSTNIKLVKESISIGQTIQFDTSEGHKAYGIYYEPKNCNYTAGADELPPLLVMAHGGPTAATSDGLNFAKQYWTGKGFAVLDVNYRGSSGYGKQYRDLLLRKMGIYEFEDVVNGATYLINQGLVDANRISISGGSAGGFITLGAITISKVFKAAVSLYGISELEILAVTTHKFESAYLTQLIGPYPEDATIYKQRSPVNNIANITTPVGFFQGLDDPIVPPDQTKLMFDAIKDKGIPTFMVLFKGKQIAENRNRKRS